MIRRALLLPALVALPLPAWAAAQPQEEGWTPPALPGPVEGFAELREPLQQAVAAHAGEAGVVLYDPETGERLSIRGEERFPSASMIKIPVLFETLLAAEEGRLSLHDPVVMLAGDRAPGAGILRHFSAPFTLTVGDAALLMTALSDNSATNLLIEKLGPRRISDRMVSMGLPSTRVFRKVFAQAAESFDPAGSERWGFGVTTPWDLARLLAWIHRGEAVSEEASREMLRMLEAQTHRVGLPRHLPEGTRLAHKTGSISAARHDCGIVFGPRREYVLCVMTRENEDRSWGWENEAEALQAEVSRIVFDALNPSRE